MKKSKLKKEIKQAKEQLLMKLLELYRSQFLDKATNPIIIHRSGAAPGWMSIKAAGEIAQFLGEQNAVAYPDDEQRVLITEAGATPEENEVSEGFREDGVWYYASGNEALDQDAVIAWRELPEPYIPVNGHSHPEAAKNAQQIPAEKTDD
jgi:hypothetical protein